MRVFSADLNGSGFLVTGASSGIGERAALVLAQSGAKVALVARRRDRLEALAARISELGGVAIAAPADVTDPEAFAAAHAHAEKTIGPLDGLINNAGIGGETVPALDVTREGWERVVATNLSAPFFAAQTFARGIVQRGGSGTIVNIASIVGLRTGGSLSAYAASKAGLIHLTRILALEWARHGIRVNALAPGYIRTELNAEFLDVASDAIAKRIPQRRIGTLDDIEGPLLFFASQASTYVTGTVLPVDGGHVVSSL
jgi:NAD(P)-dependent dehydrogenase (short-subunit alcohol dehydrogenase family)